MRQTLAAHGQAKFVVTLWLGNGQTEPKVIGSKVRHHQFENKSTFTAMPSLQDVFAGAAAQELARLAALVGQDCPVFSSSEYTFASQSVILRGLHVARSQGPAGTQKVSIHFLEMFGSPTSIFRTTALPGLPTDQSASDLAVDTLFGLVNPLLELLRSTKAMSGNREDQSQQLIALRKSEEKLKARLEPLAPLPTSANSSVTEFPRNRAAGNRHLD